MRAPRMDQYCTLVVKVPVLYGAGTVLYYTVQYWYDTAPELAHSGTYLFSSVTFDFCLAKRLVSSPPDRDEKFILHLPDNFLCLHFRIRLLFDRYLHYEHSIGPDFGL